VFDVEFLDVVSLPGSLTTPGPDARRAESGLWYEILRPGTGAAPPSPDSIVGYTVTRWTASGRAKHDIRKPFRGRLSRIRDQTVRGGLELLTEGGAIRVWIPTEPEYASSPVAIDLELLSIETE